MTRVGPEFNCKCFHCRHRGETHRGSEGSDTQKPRGVEDRGRNWNDPVARKAGSHQKLKVGNKSLLEPLEGAWPWQHLDFGPLAFRTERE